MALLEVPTDLLVAHPENSNFMDSVTLKKLKTHIEQTGRYEPLTVRPHPSEKGKFQVINGHNRLRVLRGLSPTLPIVQLAVRPSALGRPRPHRVFESSGFRGDIEKVGDDRASYSGLTSAKWTRSS